MRDERELLENWLEFHRSTLMVKCEGLTDDQRRDRAIEGSLLSLHGLVRHLTEVERYWFRRVLLRDSEVAPLWFDSEVEGSPMVPLEGAIWKDDLRTWKAECDASRQIAAGLDLDHTGICRGRPVSLRGIMFHMIQEYARHNGHADILREFEDGSVGL
jgi:uncharacterized damage-inducible protein DinB